MYIDVAKEIEKLKSSWHEKGKEIENEFKRLYKLPQPAPKLKKKRNGKQLQKEENKDLSSSKEFLIKASLHYRPFSESPCVTLSFSFNQKLLHVVRRKEHNTPMACTIMMLILTPEKFLDIEGGHLSYSSVINVGPVCSFPSLVSMLFCYQFIDLYQIS